ncbi:hypothetical protein NEMIN01_0772 [Nematocida minor]|uniref:uncharacterized protein n=1 Tax=Nematocida minor TaxID=1912983 RepID=UPI00221FE0AE|nr:uncharacterized protein NEMIN01_0772 [Nematocida minor]KAI5189909.1 hypothetical protein NEMIN01_0772 [Nematocida minor]
MDRVKVFLRVKGDKRDGVFSFSDHSVLDTSGVYDFDRIFYGFEQETVFKSISPMIDMCMDGYNMTVFTYGQTGSGKTYTMEGTPAHPGIIPLSIRKVFDKKVSSLSISVVEVYNEKIFDLVSESALTVRDGKSGVVLDGVRTVECQSEQDAMQVFEKASENRRTGSNGINSKSSRSHMIFTMCIVKEMEGFMIESKITLVDLAGSEKMDLENASDSSEYAVKKQKLSNKSLETSNINRSLLYLSRIISTLSSESRARHINYRDSKLTFILRDSLSQDSNLAIIGTVEPEDQTETKSTINFLSAAKKIKLTPKSTADEKTTEKLISQIRHLSSENTKLKTQIKSLLDVQERAHSSWALEALGAAAETMQKMIAKTERANQRVDGFEKLLKKVREENNSIGSLLFQKLLDLKLKEIDEIDACLQLPPCKK